MFSKLTKSSTESRLHNPRKNVHANVIEGYHQQYSPDRNFSRESLMEKDPHNTPIQVPSRQYLINRNSSSKKLATILDVNPEHNRNDTQQADYQLRPINSSKSPQSKRSVRVGQQMKHASSPHDHDVEFFRPAKLISSQKASSRSNQRKGISNAHLNKTNSHSKGHAPLTDSYANLTTITPMADSRGKIKIKQIKNIYNDNSLLESIKKSCSRGTTPSNKTKKMYNHSHSPDNRESNNLINSSHLKGYKNNPNKSGIVASSSNLPQKILNLAQLQNIFSSQPVADSNSTRVKKSSKSSTTRSKKKLSRKKLSPQNYKNDSEIQFAKEIIIPSSAKNTKSHRKVISFENGSIMKTLSNPQFNNSLIKQFIGKGSSGKKDLSSSSRMLENTPSKIKSNKAIADIARQTTDRNIKTTLQSNLDERIAGFEKAKPLFDFLTENQTNQINNVDNNLKVINELKYHFDQVVWACQDRDAQLQASNQEKEKLEHEISLMKEENLKMSRQLCRILQENQNLQDSVKNLQSVPRSTSHTLKNSSSVTNFNPSRGNANRVSNNTNPSSDRFLYSHSSKKNEQEQDVELNGDFKSTAAAAATNTNNTNEIEVSNLRVREAKLLRLLQNLRVSGVDVDRAYNDQFNGDINVDFFVNNKNPIFNADTFDNYFKLGQGNINNNRIESDRYGVKREELSEVNESAFELQDDEEQSIKQQQLQTQQVHHFQGMNIRNDENSTDIHQERRHVSDPLLEINQIVEGQQQFGNQNEQQQFFNTNSQNIHHDEEAEDLDGDSYDEELLQQQLKQLSGENDGVDIPYGQPSNFQKLTQFSSSSISPNMKQILLNQNIDPENAEYFIEEQQKDQYHNSISPKIKNQLKLDLNTVKHKKKASSNQQEGQGEQQNQGEEDGGEEALGFHDEFMSKVGEFSLSWRQAALAERRY